MTEDNMAGLLEKIIIGKEVDATIGHWLFLHKKNDVIFDLNHRDAEYSFEIGELDDEIIKFTNYHRYAKKGNGTKTLKELEDAFQALANKKKMPVRLMFEEFWEQPSTIGWLEKNGYVLIDRAYSKQFDPESS